MAFKDFDKKPYGQRDFQRQSFQGNWTCSDCGAKITELPFQPTEDRPIYCKDCHQKRRQERFSR